MHNLFRYSLVVMLLGLALSNHAQEWESRASLPTTELGRNHPVTFEIDGFGYMVTGGTDFGLSNDFYRYDPDADTWQIMDAFPGPARGFAYGVSYNGKGYLGFGLGENNALNDLWEYNPVTDSWRQLASCPCNARLHPAFLANNGKLFVGLGNSNQNMNDWWEYDIGIDNWIQRPDYPGSPRHHPYHFSIDEYVYVAFGHGETIYNDLYRYDPALMVWDRMADLPGEGRVAGTQFSYNGKGYALSGQGNDHDYLDTGEFWEYDPATDTWTALIDHTGAGRWAPGSFVIDGYAYLVAGEDITVTQRRDMMRFDLQGNSGTSNFKSLESIAAFPNPTDDYVELNISQTIDEIRVLDAQGRYLQVLPFDRNRIDLSSLVAGKYTLIIDAGSEQFMSQTMKL